MIYLKLIWGFCNSIFAKGNVNIAGKVNVAGSVNNAGTFHANDIKLLSGKYINLGAITGSNGYGLRENSGDIQFKNSGVIRLMSENINQF